MSVTFEERITKHQSYTNLEEVIQLLEEIDNSELTNSRNLELIDRIRETLNFLKEAMDRAYPWLVPTNSLNAISNEIIQIKNNLSNFINGKNQAYLNNISAQLERLLPYFPHFTVIKTSEDIEGIRNAVISFRKSVGQHLSNVEKEGKETLTTLTKNHEKLKELTSAIENQKSRIDSVISDFQNQFLNTQNSRTNEFNDYQDK